MKKKEKKRWDRWDTRLPNPKDQQKAIDLFYRSGAETKSDFVRSQMLNEDFKVITVDESSVKFERKLSEFTAQVNKIGVLYNQAVRGINSYHSVKTAQILLRKLETYSKKIEELLQNVLKLTSDYRQK